MKAAEGACLNLFRMSPGGLNPEMVGSRGSSHPLFLSASGWKCTKCDMRENLWLNMTDGSILCGRRYFDGSGGNNHAVEHYRETLYPLAVKLGTITPDGAGKKGTKQTLPLMFPLRFLARQLHLSQLRFFAH